MYVCICKGITDTQIRAAVESGAGSIQDIRRSLGVATQCGKCVIATKEIFAEAQGNGSDGPLFHSAH